MGHLLTLPAAAPRRSSQASPTQSPGSSTVTALFESRVYALSLLRKEMVSKAMLREHWCLRSVRPFTQKFCEIMRRFSGLSKEELCEHLNKHPRISKLKELPGSYRFYPITPDFISDLENNIIKILEYNPYGGGFLGIGAYGIPTLEVARTIAEICDCTREFRRFEDWCSEYLHSEHEAKEQ